MIVFHLEQMIQDLGHVFAGSLESFVDLKEQVAHFSMDCALVDIDLADGPSGPLAVKWLSDRGIPSIFVTGQQPAAAQCDETAIGIVGKPITELALAAALGTVGDQLRFVNNSHQQSDTQRHAQRKNVGL